MKKYITGISVSLAAAFFICLLSSAFLPLREQDIYESVIRLHVIAASDSDADQTIKLAVRDAVLADSAELFAGADIAEAKAVASSDIEKLKATADAVLESFGAEYTSEVVLCTEDYPTRNYENVSLPAGKYLSLQIKLGDASGHNWWCVMFPPMCIGAAKDSRSLTGCGNTGVFSSKRSVKYRFSFFLLELFN